MGAFCEFTHGFMHGMFDNMFGGFGMFRGFGPCCCFPWQFNAMSLFSVPSWNFGSLYRYPEFTPMTPQYNLNTPVESSVFNNFTVPACNFNAFNYSIGDTFTFSNINTSNTKTNTNTNTNTSVHEVGMKRHASNIKAKHWTKMTDAEMKSIYGDYEKSATERINATAGQLNSYLKGKGVLEGKGQAFIDAQNKYGISAAFLIAVCMNESGKGTSDLARKKNNVGGIRYNGSTEFRKFASVEACIDHMAKLIKNSYVNQSLTKLYQINAKYCPVNDSTDKTGNNYRWASAVDKYMNEVEQYV